MRLRSAETLRALMRQQSLSMGALATAARCSKGFVSHLLSGRRSTCTDDLAARIASALEVPVHVLFAPTKSISERRADSHRLPLATGVPNRIGHHPTDARSRWVRPTVAEPKGRFASRCDWVPQRVLLGDRGKAVGWFTNSPHRHPSGNPAGEAPGMTSPLLEVTPPCNFAAARH